MSTQPNNQPQFASLASSAAADRSPSPFSFISENPPVSRASSRASFRRHSPQLNGDDDNLEMSDWDNSRPRPGLLSRPSDGRSAEPLLEEGYEDRGRGQTSYEGLRETDDRARLRHQMRSRSPASAAVKMETRRKYMLAGMFLLLSLISFVIQTETAVYVQHELGWKKAYSMLYLTHGSWSVLWPVQLLILKIQKPSVPWRSFLRAQIQLLKSTAQMVMCGTPRLSPTQARRSPTIYIIKKVVFITCALTIAGSTWYVAVNMTSPSDLTAIYNCSAFFAYVFSIFMLNEKPRKDKIFAVAIAIAGVLVVAYGDSKEADPGHELEAKTRAWGNIIIGIGSVLYGFYEVLYKKMACPPEGTSPGRSVIFANAVGSGIGMITLFVLWIPIPVLHILGYEKFELPTGEAAWMLAISVFANATFSGSFLVLISLTSPVLSSVASLLTIFLVAITDWFITGTPLSFAAIVGGLMIIAAFVLLSWSTWVEMNEEKSKEPDADITTSTESSDDD